MGDREVLDAGVPGVQWDVSREKRLGHSVAAGCERIVTRRAETALAGSVSAANRAVREAARSNTFYHRADRSTDKDFESSVQY